MVCASFVTFYCEVKDGRIDREMETSPLEYLDPRPCRRHVGSMILPTTTASQMVVFLSVFFFLRPTLNLMYTSISFSFGCFFYFIPLFSVREYILSTRKKLPAAFAEAFSRRGNRPERVINLLFLLFARVGCLSFLSV